MWAFFFASIITTPAIKPFFGVHDCDQAILYRSVQHSLYTIVQCRYGAATLLAFAGATGRGITISLVQHAAPFDVQQQAARNCFSADSFCLAAMASQPLRRQLLN